MKVLCTICARKGSKGVPNKNVKEILGKPLIAFSIQQALESRLFDKIVVSTDSVEIREIAKRYGAESWFSRPAELSSDDSPKIPVIQHALEESEKKFSCKFDHIIDLDATSPLRNVEDIRKAYKVFLKDGFDNLISGTRSRKNPYFNMIESKNGKVELSKQLKNTPVNRQQSPQVYDMNASIYVWSRDFLLKNNSLFSGKLGFYEMPEDRSIDIDSSLDWEIVKMIMEKKE
jgi:CMP-N,N'-diacetyllegionaminic acid synthase|tara:strand:- start:269 stop:961 length:693 start_codon:yes stop_codon:yes gene_type:complete